MEANEQRIVYMMVGLPGSGKSTSAKNIKATAEADGKKCCIISSDAIRAELFGDEGCQQNSRKVFSLYYQRAIEAYELGTDIIILDATNIRPKDRKAAIQQLKQAGVQASYMALVMQTPYDECVDRDSKRSRTVGEEVIDRMQRNYRYPTMSEGFDYIIPVE